tara:strand:- start:162 stop:380 length:219 start_codon:yes stop_codon:yes gene_type:complete
LGINPFFCQTLIAIREETMKFFQYSGNCHRNKVLKTYARPSVSLVVLLLSTIFILPSSASAEVKKNITEVES